LAVSGKKLEKFSAADFARPFEGICDYFVKYDLPQKYWLTGGAIVRNLTGYFEIKTKLMGKLKQEQTNFYRVKAVPPKNPDTERCRLIHIST